MIASATCNTGTGYCFAPSVITIPVGGSVTWTNTTSAPHTATDDGGTWFTPWNA